MPVTIAIHHEAFHDLLACWLGLLMQTPFLGHPGSHPVIPRAANRKDCVKLPVSGFYVIGFLVAVLGQRSHIRVIDSTITRKRQKATTHPLNLWRCPMFLLQPNERTLAKRKVMRYGVALLF